MSSRRTRGSTSVVVVYVVLAVVTLVALGPSFWVILSSFKTSGQTLSGSIGPPKPFTVQGYVDAFTQVDFAIYVANTFLYAVGGSIGAVVTAMLAAYPLTRFRFRGRNSLVAAFSVSLAVPVVGLATPEYFIMRELGLYNTRLGMVVFYSALMFPLTFVIFRAFLAALPSEVEEAAVIDGAGYFRIIGTVVLPLSRPAFATVTVVSFVNIWNEFFFANLLTGSSEVQNVQIALASFQGQFASNVGALLAGTSIVMVVPMVVFLLMQRQVIAGLTAGAIR